VPLVRSVSATTRPPRPGERHGVDYYFLAEDQFAQLREKGEFLECFQIFGGHWYGTLRQEVERILSAGNWALLEIDVQGARRIRQQNPNAVTIFILPPDEEELVRRLTGRGTESPDRIAERLARMKAELAFAGDYQYQVVNDDLSAAVNQLRQILLEESRKGSTAATE